MAEQSAFLTAFDEMQKKKGGFNAPAPQESVVDTVGQAPQVQSPFSQQAAAATAPLAAPIDLAAAPAVQAPQADASAEVAGDPNILGAQTPESTIEPFVGNTQTADMRGQDVKKSPINPTAQPGQGGPQFAERGSPQDFFLSQTNDGTTALSPEKITRGQEYAKQQGLNFDPATGFSQSTEAPQVQLPSTIQNAGGQSLAGFKPKYKGQSLTDFMAGRDGPSAASVQVQDPQGRFRRQAAPVAGETPEQNQARTDALFPEQADFEQASADREARQAARPDFGTAVSDRDRREARGDDISDADRRDIAKASRQGASVGDIARGEKVAAANGIDRKTGKSLVSPMTPSDILAREKWEDEKSKSGKLTTAEKNYLLAERKYNDILEKEKNGTPLTPAEELARERFEYEQDRDAKSDATGPDKSPTERNIDTMMKANPAMSYTEAANIVQNVVSKTTDPLSGRTSVTNIAEGTSTPMQSTEPLASPVLNLKPKAAGEGLYERGANETGVIASFLRGGQKVVGQAGFDMASDESLEVKKELDAFQGSLSRAFQEGDRFSSSQDKILREELDVTLGVWKDPKTFKANMRSLDKVLRKRHSDLTDNYNDLTLDSDFRADSKSKAKVIEQALNDMGVTQDAKPTEGDTPPEGINPRAAAAWANMSPEGRALFQPQTK